MTATIGADELVACGMDAEAARTLAHAITTALQTQPPAVCWNQTARGLLKPTIPFAAHRLIYDRLFADWDPAHGPRPAWQPDPQEAANTNIGVLMKERGISHYKDLYAWSVTDRSGFWQWAVDRLGVRFHDRPRTVLDLSDGVEHPRFLSGARYNAAENCFQAAPETPAIVWSSAGQPIQSMTYARLHATSARIANCLRAAGWRTGDAIAIDMPMTTDAVAIYLGIVMAGMTVVSIADSMAPAEVETRLRIAGARGIFTCHHIVRGGKTLPLYEKVLEAKPPRAVVLGAKGAGLRAGDLAWDVFLAGDPDETPRIVSGQPDDTTNVLFSSGTTGDPKAIPWTHLTPIKAAIDGHLHLDIRPGDVVAWPTNLGWMMGPWLIYAALMNRATIALYGDAPTLPDFGRFVQDTRVTVLGLVPSIVKTWRSDDRMTAFDFSAIRCFGSTGETSNPDDYLYLMMLAGYRPVIEYCGGTEIGGGYITGTLVQPASPATFSTPALGSSFMLLDENGHTADNGEVFMVPPTLGLSLTLLNRDHHEVYFEGTPPGPGGVVLRRHGDQIERLPGGYFRALGRVDDTMNLGGIKVSAAEIERILDPVDGVDRTAAIAVDPPGGGPSELVIYLVPRDRTATAETMIKQLQNAIKTKLNPLFRIADLVIVDALPVTASNKIMRRELRARYRNARKD